LSDVSRAQLLRAYRATTYRADVGGRRVDLRIGEPVDLRELSSERQPVETWAFLSAANPGSRPLSTAENLERHRDLVAACTARGFAVYEGWGIGETDDWDPEISLLVLGIDRKEAVSIGRAFGQLAVVCGQAGGVAELVEVG
jgi:hypothetical protein